jgi:hypothetical protein
MLWYQTLARGFAGVSQDKIRKEDDGRLLSWIEPKDDNMDQRRFLMSSKVSAVSVLKDGLGQKGGGQSRSDSFTC